MNWFNDENIELLSAIPFNFDPGDKLFKKKKVKNRFEIFLNEISLPFSSTQINEGGFFVMIGRKL